MSITRYIILALSLIISTSLWSTDVDVDASSSMAMMNDTIIFNISSAAGEQGDQVCVDITVENFTDISTGTIQLNFDPTVACVVCPVENLELSCFNDNGANNLTEALFNCNFTQFGLIRFLWITDPLTFDDGCLVTRFCFDLDGMVGECSEITIDNDFLDIVYDDGTSANVIVNPGEICISPSELSCREGHCKTSFGNDDGSIYFWGVGGTAPYTFDVNGGLATGTLDEFEEGQLDNLPAGTYTITITDAAGNTCTSTVNIFESSDYPMSMELSALPTTCFDASNGIVRIDAIAGGISGVSGACGGSFDYNIEWSNGVFNIDSLNRVPEGLYAVTVTDFFGCRLIDSIDITLDTLLASIQVLQEPSCNGAADGIIVICGSGGVPGPGGIYDFVIEGVDPGNFFDEEVTGVTCDTIFNVPNGVYEITVVDYARIPCISDVVDTMFNSGPNFEIQIISDQDSCAGGMATVQFIPSVIGTYLPTLINTTSGASVSTGNLGGIVTATLQPGTYTISMQEFNVGCFTDFTFVVPDIEPLLIILDTEEPGCSGNDGRIELMVSGGTEPYTFEWNIDNLNGPIRENLDGGEYKVTITDDNGCQDSLTVEFLDGDIIPLDAFVIQAVSCSGAEDGIVGATVNNSTTYTYTWSDGTTDLGNGETLENLGGGTYFVTAVDDEGCQATDSVFLANPDSDIAIDVTQTGPSCSNSDDGNLSPVVNSGAGPFTFTWQDPVTEEVLLEGQVFTGGVGEYLLTVEDGLGCSFDTLLTMALPPNAIILAASNISGVSCFGTCDGVITLEAITGMAGTPFIYVVNGGAPMNSTGPVTFTDVCAGENWALAVDATCISDTLFFIIPDQDVVGIDSLGSQIIPPSCAGDSDGSITLALEGVDIADATITWIGQGVTGTSIADLPAGTYEVEIAYGDGCTVTDEITLTDPPVLVVEVDPFGTAGINCSNSTSGRVAVVVTGGNEGAYTYTWSPNVSTTDIAGQLGPGLYSVTVEDSKGCTASTSYLLESAPPVEAVIPTPELPACNGQQTCIEVTSASGGTGNFYTFTINNGPRIEIDTCFAIFAGEYLITVFDSVGCSFDTTLTIDQPEELNVQAGPDQVLNIGEESDPVSAQIVSFLPVDTISWSPTATLRSETPDNQVITAFPSQTTTYEVTVTDEAGCTATSDVLIEVEFRRNAYFPSGFSPNNDDINDYFQPIVGIGVTEVISFSVYDRWGNRVYVQEGFVPDPVVNRGWDGRYNGSEVQPGVYVYYAEVAYVDGARIQYAGDVTVVR